MMRASPGKLTTSAKRTGDGGTGVFDSAWIILVEGRAETLSIFFVQVMTTPLR